MYLVNKLIVLISTMDKIGHRIEKIHINIIIFKYKYNAYNLENTNVLKI